MLAGAIIFFVLGSVFAAIGFSLRRTTVPAARADAVITSLRHESSRKFGTNAFPTVAFTLPDGRYIESETPTAASEEDGEVVGAHVTVSYDPAHPETVDLAGAPTKVLARVFIGLGFAFDALAVVLLILFAL